MKSFVRFYVLSGEVEVTKNNESTTLKEGQILITEPAILSMKTETGSKLLGIQISKNTGMV
jgi:quercetin dioxygenase-like cupin family protein